MANRDEETRRLGRPSHNSAKTLIDIGAVRRAAVEEWARADGLVSPSNPDEVHLAEAVRVLLDKALGRTETTLEYALNIEHPVPRRVLAAIRHLGRPASARDIAELIGSRQYKVMDFIKHLVAEGKVVPGPREKTGRRGNAAQTWDLAEPPPE